MAGNPPAMDPPVGMSEDFEPASGTFLYHLGAYQQLSASGTTGSSDPADSPNFVGL
jgi:hypothetical protein